MLASMSWSLHECRGGGCRAAARRRQGSLTLSLTAVHSSNQPTLRGAWRGLSAVGQ